MQNGDYPKRLFIRRVGNQVVPHPFEAYRVAGEVRAAVSLMRKGNQFGYRAVDFVD